MHPPQAEGVYAFTQNAKKWVADTGANRFRRAMFTTFYRSAPARASAMVCVARTILNTDSFITRE